MEEDGEVKRGREIENPDIGEIITELWNVVKIWDILKRSTIAFFNG